jgi:hypothetical protein
MIYMTRVAALGSISRLCSTSRHFSFYFFFFYLQPYISTKGRVGGRLHARGITIASSNTTIATLAAITRTRISTSLLSVAVPQLRKALILQNSTATLQLNSASTRTRAMSSDADYMAFLDKANAQRDAGQQQAQTSSTSSNKIRTETVHSGVSVPSSLESIDAYYMSETDEPFEPVVLKWDEAKKGVWPGDGTLAFSSFLSFLKYFNLLLLLSFFARNWYRGLIANGDFATIDRRLCVPDYEIKRPCR